MPELLLDKIKKLRDHTHYVNSLNAKQQCDEYEKIIKLFMENSIAVMTQALSERSATLKKGKLYAKK